MKKKKYISIERVEYDEIILDDCGLKNVFKFKKGELMEYFRGNFTWRSKVIKHYPKAGCYDVYIY